MDGKGERVLVVHNVGTLNIPSGCPMEMCGIEGTAEPIHKVRAPAAASLSQVLVNGDSMLYAGSYSSIPDSWPRWSSFSGATQPTIGGAVGNTTGTLGMVSGNTGFVCLAVHGTATASGTLAADGTDDAGVAQEGRVLVRPFSASAAPLFWSVNASNIFGFYSDKYGAFPCPVTTLIHTSSGSCIINKWMAHSLIKSGTNYYCGVLNTNTSYGLQTPGHIFKASAPDGTWTNTSYPQIIRDDYQASGGFYLAPSIGNNLLAVTRSVLGTNTYAFDGGTAIQVMEYFATAGTWGTSFTNTTAALGQNAPSYKDAYVAHGPWQGRIMLPNCRAANNDYQPTYATPSSDKYPVYDGTSWSYVTCQVFTSGTRYVDQVSTTFVGIEGSGDWAWAVGVYRGKSYAGGTWTSATGYQRYSSASGWGTYPLISSGTWSSWTLKNFISTSGGGLIGWRIIPSQQTMYGTLQGYPVQFSHFKNGTRTDIGNTLALTNLNNTNYFDMRPIAIGDWSGTNLGDLYVVPSRGCLVYGSGLDMADSSKAMQGILKLTAGTGVWQQYGNPYFSPTMRADEPNTWFDANSGLVL